MLTFCPDDGNVGELLPGHTAQQPGRSLLLVSSSLILLFRNFLSLVLKVVPTSRLNILHTFGFDSATTDIYPSSSYQ